MNKVGKLHAFARADNGSAVGAGATPNPSRQPWVRSHVNGLMTRTGAVAGMFQVSIMRVHTLHYAPSLQRLRMVLIPG